MADSQLLDKLAEHSDSIFGNDTHYEPPGSSQPTSVDNGADSDADALLSLTVILPHPPHKLQIMVSPHEQVHDVRQSIIDLPAAFQYTCFHLEYRGEAINDFIPVAEIAGLESNSDVRLVEDPYTEKEARMHFVRVRDLIGAAGDRVDGIQGILPGLSILEAVDSAAKEHQASRAEYSFVRAPDYKVLLPRAAEPAPKTIKSISLSPWNPPPAHLRHKGHLLYLTVTSNEGEQHQITAHVGGFFVNKSSSSKFDPFPRPAPKGRAAHSLLTLIELMSPSFSASFSDLQEYNNHKDPLALFQITHTIPASPWLVPATALCAHDADVTRSQETYLISGMESTDSLRDWNEEFQSARELPRATVPDRLFRERLISKLFADYNEAAAKGAVLVARGEVAPLNPTECRDAQIFVYNNIFFSFGADGAGTFTSEGGDEAARIATGKDIAGVKMVFQLDIDGLFAPATVVVDYLGKRIVAQSIVPGIFKQREPGENQIHYGAVEGKDVVAWDERFEPVFGKFSRALRVKRHPVWDRTGKKFELEASVETKGLFGTDGRKYILDLYRLTPLDIFWLEPSREKAGDSPDAAYPHRMTVLRPELVESFGRRRMRDSVDTELARQEPATKEQLLDGTVSASGAKSEGPHAEEERLASAPGASGNAELEPRDTSRSRFALNPDAFSGQLPEHETEKKELERDENEVRQACDFLQRDVIPGLLRDLVESDISFPMDGRSLSILLHKRGINVRYIGQLAAMSSGTRLASLRSTCVQDMIARSFKHIASRYLRDLPLPMASACLSHLLNCLLVPQLSSRPAVDLEATTRDWYPKADLAFESVTVDTFRSEIEKEVKKRFRYELESNWPLQIRALQLLREVSIKLGIQLQPRAFAFMEGTIKDSRATESLAPALPDSAPGAAVTNVESKKRRKKAREVDQASPSSPNQCSAFRADDIVNIVPVIKTCCPRSSLPEEALEAGRISILQGQRKLGQELLLESLSLHEQIYGLIHPEVARAYGALSTLYYQLDEKDAAVELARKAIIIAERTIGVDSPETLLDYLNLSLFLHQNGESDRALVYVKHALELWKVIYGPDHPDSITTFNNGAVMLQSLKDYHESRRWFEQSLRICEDIFGKQTLNAASVLFQLAQSLALDQEPKAAVGRMRESYNIFLNELGPTDKNTKEADSWLEQLTQNAVSLARHAKDAQARHLRAAIKASPRVEPRGARTIGLPVPEPRASTAASGKVDMRSIDELMRFIEGDQKKRKGHKKHSNEGTAKSSSKAAN